MKIFTIALFLPLLLFADLKEDYERMLSSFSDFPQLPLEVKEIDFFKAFTNAKEWKAYKTPDAEGYTDALKECGLPVTIPSLIKFFRFRPSGFSEGDKEKNLREYDMGNLVLIGTPTGTHLTTDTEKEILILHSHENWKQFFTVKDGSIQRMYLLKSGTLSEEEIEKLRLEPGEVVNASQPAGLSENHLHD